MQPCFESSHLAPAPYDHGQSAFRPQCEFLYGPHDVTRTDCEREVFHQCGKHDACFLQGEACADADTRPGSERQIGKAVDFRSRRTEEAGWVEFIWPAPQRAMTMQNVWRDHDHRTALDPLAGKLVRLERRPADRRDRWIKPIGLVDHGPRFDQTVGETVDTAGEFRSEER